MKHQLNFKFSKLVNNTEDVKTMTTSLRIYICTKVDAISSQCCSVLVKKLTALPLPLKRVKSNDGTATAKHI